MLGFEDYIYVKTLKCQDISNFDLHCGSKSDSSSYIGEVSLILKVIFSRLNYIIGS